jgi:hypothetical protein
MGCTGCYDENRNCTRWWVGQEWPGGIRTAPSAGALFPIELYIAAGNVEKSCQGLYKYDARNHSIIKINDRDKREEVRKAALGQSAVANAPACIIIGANFSRTELSISQEQANTSISRVERMPEYLPSMQFFKHRDCNDRRHQGGSDESCAWHAGF